MFSYFILKKDGSWHGAAKDTRRGIEETLKRCLYKSNDMFILIVTPSLTLSSHNVDIVNPKNLPSREELLEQREFKFWEKKGLKEIDLEEFLTWRNLRWIEEGPLIIKKKNRGSQKS